MMTATAVVVDLPAMCWEREESKEPMELSPKSENLTPTSDGHFSIIFAFAFKVENEWAF
jgi:hypothetical protein